MMKIAKEAGVALKCQLTNQSQFDGHWNVSRHSVEEEIFIWGHHYRFSLVAEYCILGLNVHFEIGAVHRASGLKRGWKAPGCLKLIKAVNALLLYDVSFTKFAIPSGRRGGRSWLSVPAANSHQFMKQELGFVSIHPWQTNTIWSLNSTFDPQRSAEHSAFLTASMSWSACHTPSEMRTLLGSFSQHSLSLLTFDHNSFQNEHTKQIGYLKWFLRLIRQVLFPVGLHG